MNPGRLCTPASATTHPAIIRRQSSAGEATRSLAYHAVAMRRRNALSAASLALGCLIIGGVPALAAGSGTEVSSSHSGAMGVLADPTTAFVLLLVALLGVGLESLHPGAIVFASAGVLAGALAVVGLLNLPVNSAGIVLVAVAAALLVVDTSGHSHGLLSIAGIIAAIAGGLLLFRGSAPGSSVNIAVVVAIPVTWGVIWVAVSRRALKVRRMPFATTSHELLGLSGVVRTGNGTSGIAAVGGELWRVVSRDGEPIEAGQEVVVMAEDGLTLIVERVPGTGPPHNALTNASPRHIGEG